MVPLKNSHTSFIQQNPLVQYAEPAAVPQYVHQPQQQEQQYVHQQPQQQYVSQPTPVHYAIEPHNLIHYTPGHASTYSYPSPAPASSPVYSTHLQPLHQTAPTHHVQIQQSIEYPSRKIVEYITPPAPGTATTYKHSTPTVPAPAASVPVSAPAHNQIKDTAHHSGPTLDFFGTYGKSYGSLLDSYIPSSIIVERQKSLYGRPSQLHTSTAYTSPLTSYSSPSIYASNSNTYNTIAYSSPHVYDKNSLKRSPKPTSGIKYEKPIKSPKQ